MMLLISILWGCSKGNENSDAYGNFEATEINVSSESSGKILDLSIEEGSKIEAGAVVGIIDSLPLYLKKEQLIASRAAISSKTGNITAQEDVIREQLKTLLREQSRFTKLVKDSAATSKQLDDINAQISLLNRQINSIETQNAPVINELKAFDSQIDQLNDQLKKCIIKNPLTGIVLAKYAEKGEVTSFGKPLYKIADLDKMILRVYVSGEQLPSILIGQKVKVFVDKNKNENRQMEGRIQWISSIAEFTPKIIQTKEERVNLVYAAKVLVENDGSLKIGMPGEIKLIR
jgi:HlyD family secretion protein